MSDRNLIFFLKDKVPYMLFLLILSIALSIIIQTLTRTPFLLGGRGSIEFLYITGYAETFGYGKICTVLTILSIMLNPILGNIIYAVKLSIIIILITYFIALYLLSSTISNKWLALTVVPSAFLPMISDTIFKGDYMLLTAVTLTTLFMAGILNHIIKPSRKALIKTAVALVLIPFSDPQVLSLLSIIIYLTIVYCIIFSNRKLLPHYIMLFSLYSGSFMFSISLFVGSIDKLWQVNPLTQFYSNIIFSATLFVATTLGLISLYRRGLHKILYIIVIWILTLTILSILDSRLLSFSIPILLSLVTASLSYLEGLAKITRIEDEKGGESQYEVEVNVNRLFAVLPAILLIILLLLAIPSTIVLGDHETVPPPRVEDIYEASTFLSKNVRNDLIVAHPSIANWLLSTSRLNVLPVIDDKTFKVNDLLTTTSFRLINAFIKVDDWEPFSAAKAPLIHVYDGKEFKPIVYLDDSYSRFTLEGSNDEYFIESPYKAKFLSYRWNESSNQIALTISFQTPGLLVNKTITMSKLEPKVSIEYSALVIKKNVSVKRFTLNVYSLPMDVLPELEIIGHEAKMDVRGQRLKISFEGKISSITQDKTSDQKYTICNFIPLNDGVAYGKVVIEALNPKPSGEKLYYSSFFDEAKRYGVKYVIIPKEHQVFMQEALPHKVECFTIKDSFVRFIINSWGNIFQEAPAYAEVLNETVIEGSRIVLYKTAGLYIYKEFQTKDNILNVKYSVQPYKNRTLLVLSTLSIWIDYARTIISSNISLEDRNVELVLDSGKFKIQFNGNLTDIKVELHPEYRQMRIIASFQLHPSNDNIGFTIESYKKAIIEYNHTTRPKMKDNDEIIFSIEEGLFKPVKELKLYTIYNIMP